MTEEIKDILKRYDEIGALILEQKLDEYGDKIGQVPEGSDAASFEEYIQDVAREETEKAKQTLESEPDEKLGGKSLREYFDSMTLEEKEEALEYSAVTLDCGVPASLIASIASDDRESVRDYCSTVIGDSAWTEEELDDQDKLFEIEYQKVKACLDVLIEMKEFCFVQAVLDRFMSYHQTKEFVAKQIDAFMDILVNFFQRQVVICLIEGILYGTGFMLVGLPYGFLLGFLLGVLNLVPFLGSLLCMPLVLPISYFGDGGSLLRLIGVLSVWVGGLLLDGYLITPKIQGEKTGLGYAGVIFSFVFWGVVFHSMLGLLLAIPLSAFCVVLWRALKEKYIKGVI